MWGIDVMGPISSTAFSQYRFIVVVVVYFTNKVKVASYANVRRSGADKECQKGQSQKFEVCSKIKHHIIEQRRQPEKEKQKNKTWIVEKVTETCKDWHKEVTIYLLWLSNVGQDFFRGSILPIGLWNGSIVAY
ncbi:RNA-directed DNA polymerase (Reverse transcriptase), Ribonuclease H [Gossypium australe]|uniref:RNA-directed DNA polymerase (Reverse transcriptase), Ribonuclease H n=1 Tax=Gossypium australe TaxID=47621 RepID=A0A5B6UVR9_9ROSI|nr:RNA-directed DNA polymerase (Reverse transcriptase), Ribonuclease H [Gossypium australe]